MISFDRSMQKKKLKNIIRSRHFSSCFFILALLSTILFFVSTLLNIWQNSLQLKEQLEAKADAAYSNIENTFSVMKVGSVFIAKLASVNQKWIAPKTCASKLKSWQTKKTPLNLVVSEAGINEDVTIKSFEYKPFGGHGDYSYEISFVPYVEMKIYTTKELGTKKKAKKKKKTTRPSTKKSTKKKKTYRIVRGDTLCGISRKKYKTESKWRNIYNANKKVIEAAAKKHGRRNSDNGHWIYPGTVLTLP